jgi:DnaJ family protein B protein 12
VKSKRRYESEKESGEDSDKEVDELSRLLGDFGGKSDKNSSKGSGKKSDRESAKKSDKESGKKSDKESANKSDKKSGKKSVKDSNKENGQEPENNDTNGRQTSGEESGEDESSVEHTKATRYTKEQREEVTRVRKCPKKDYYAILGLEENCSRAEVKKAYKKISLLTHPDKNKYKDAEKAFKS